VIEFDWDADNLMHIAEHGLTPEEVEFALAHRTLEIEFQDWHDSEERYSEIGMTHGGRILVIVTTLRGPRLRVVTAHDAPRQRAKEYLEFR
jgi:uncharacterized DUF497 family protein